MEPEEDISLTEELNLPDVTEYVRQQLASMGVSIVDEQELHAYTKGNESIPPGPDKNYN